MFKFLKPAKPGASKKVPSSPAKPKAATATVQRPSPALRPPSLMTPLSSGAGAVKTPPRFDDAGPSGERPMTPERAALIQKALSVHRSQQDVFAELDGEARQKLVLMAMLTLLKEARGGK